MENNIFILHTTYYILLDIMNSLQFSSNWLKIPNLTIIGHLLSKQSGPIHILELGTYEGRSAFYMLDNFCTHSESTITTVDYMKRDNLEYNLQQVNSPKLKFIQENFFNILPTLMVSRKLYDLIYIDGGKNSQTTIFQIVNSWQLLKSGGILYLDDYLWKHNETNIERPMEAIHCFLFLYKDDFTIIFKNYQVAVRKK